MTPESGTHGVMYEWRNVTDKNEEISTWQWLLSLAAKGHFLHREGHWEPWQCSMHCWYWHASFVGVSRCHRFATHQQLLRLSSGLCYTSCRFLVGPLPWLFLNLYALSWNGGEKESCWLLFWLLTNANYTPVILKLFMVRHTFQKHKKNPKEVKTIEILDKF